MTLWETAMGIKIGIPTGSTGERETLEKKINIFQHNSGRIRACVYGCARAKTFVASVYIKPFSRERDSPSNSIGGRCFATIRRWTRARTTENRYDGYRCRRTGKRCARQPKHLVFVARGAAAAFSSTSPPHTHTIFVGQRKLFTPQPPR